jgi:putative methyltransferase (TIGR04325 family)
MKQIVTQIIKKIPVVSDHYYCQRIFPRSLTACCGVYSSFAEALESVPKGAKAGYSQPEISSHPSVAQLTACSEVGQFNSIDYPILLWLKAAFADSSSVFDLGGNVGLAYYAYRKFLNYPNDLNWLVCEIPEIVKAGEELARNQNIQDLAFTTEFAKADGSEILLSCGTLQYLEATLAELIGQLKVKPKHVLINHVPFYDGESFITLQNVGYTFCPYRIQNRAEFIAALVSLGYELVDSWEINRTCFIPFYPEHCVNAYHGFYLKLKPLLAL